jgi:hypothetical protein
MALTFPRTDILTSVAFEDQSFKLQTRQEYSRTSGGRTIGKDLGPALWMARYTTVPLPNDDALAFEAALNSLDGVIFPFEAGDLRRIYPRSKPDGSFSDTGVIATLNVNNKAMSLSGLDAGMVLSPGDYLSFDYGDSRALHQLVEGATANGFGTTPQFEVRPYIRAGATVGEAVRLKRPSGLFTLMPNTIESRLNGAIHSVVSFQAIQALS